MKLAKKKISFVKLQP